MRSWARDFRENSKARQAFNLALGLAIAVAGALLFAIDISQPRGVVDGVGYSAVVLLTSRFGRRTLLIAAAVTSTLTILAAALLPDAGISVAGMWANRSFALISIWTVALVMRQRIELEEQIRQRETNLQRHKAALEATVRECLLTDISFDQKLEFICRTGAEALQCSSSIIGLRNEQNGTLTILQSWREAPRPNRLPPGTILNEDPHHKKRLQANLTLAIEDTELDEATIERRRIARGHDVRATLAAEIYQGGPQTGTIMFGHAAPYQWSEEEAAFARALANLVALLLSTQANTDTLAALEMTDDAIFTEDADGNVQYANRAARRLAGTTTDGSAYPRPVAPLQGEHDQCDIHVEGRELEVHRSRLPAGGMITRLADVTERNRAMAERATLEDRLRQVAKMEAIGQLASGVAHDFNNILGAITGFAGFIAEDSPQGSPNRAFAERILAASKRGKEMVEQIMAFGEARAGASGITNLGRIVRKSRELLAESMSSGAGLEIACDDEPPLLIRGNEVQIGQLITNLIMNGRDALKGGEGQVRVEAARATPKEIEALLRRPDNPGERLVGDPRLSCAYARLTVSDGGAGIPAEIMDRIFEPFFSTKGRQRGTGLGLAVVHGVIRAHAGFCHLRSAAGVGTRFDIYLPLLDEQTASLPAGTVRPRPCRVLIVDDEVDMADMLSIGLERMGFQTVTAHNPMLALAAIEEDPGAFDALLTDQIMPGMHGTDLIREARRVAPRLRTILCTAYVDHSAETERLAFMADAVVYKPVEIQIVAQAITAAEPELA
ncbi:MAG TPA: ATP-binding protein [Rhodopila sp.]|nr:ATP-binding protein [Rhodopila sp.]